jgi:RimJ/RimL family protein N-acetyltransferase
MQTRPLNSPRLLLRPYSQSDLAAFTELNGDPEARRHVGGPLTRADAAVRFESFISGFAVGADAWAVTLRESGVYIGHSWLVLDEGANHPELGFILAPSFWRQGYGTEVAKAVLGYALAHRAYSRVVATVDADHGASIRVLERAGMKREREDHDKQGSYFVYSITRSGTGRLRQQCGPRVKRNAVGFRDRLNKAGEEFR